MTEQRKAFEAWAIEKKYAYRNHHGFWAYPAFSTGMMWEAWQAAIERAGQQVPDTHVLVPRELPMDGMRYVIIGFAEDAAAGKCVIYDDFWRDLLAAAPSGAEKGERT